MLPHLLPQEGAWRSFIDPRAIMMNMKRVVVCTRLRRRATRATEMRALLQHARPHGGNAAQWVKRMRSRDKSGDFAN